MMVSPESVYEELKTKSDEEVLKEIKRFRREISQLKKAIELPIMDILLTKPSPSTQIYWIRQYIIEAKKLLSERGVEYKPTKAEQRALDFNNKLSELVQIHIVRDGFFMGRTEYIVHCGETLQLILYQHGHQTIEIMSNGWGIIRNKNSFVSELQELYIGE